MSADSFNKIELFHSGDLGDTVFAIPAFRRLAYPAHMILYPHPGATRHPARCTLSSAGRCELGSKLRPGLLPSWLAPLSRADAIDG
jgi:hypothetical protein